MIVNTNGLSQEIHLNFKVVDPGKVFLTFLARFPLCLLR